MAAPAQPSAILRGHRAQVQAAAFVRTDAAAGADETMEGAPAAEEQRRLATGDADGFVVLWDLAIVRPRAVWRAHTNSILGLAGWGADQVVTHGRDHKLVVWQVGVADEARLSTVLPLDRTAARPSGAGGGDSINDDDRRPKPWVVHVLDVNSMNFCAFAWCRHVGATTATSTSTASATTASDAPVERLVAVPNALILEAVDIFHLPSQQRRATVQVGVKGKDGMLMALALFYRGRTLVVVAAFENGAAVVATLDAGLDGEGGGMSTPPTIRYRAQPHSQPILSLDVAPDQSYFVTSGADAVLAKHPIPVPMPSPAEAEEEAEAVQQDEEAPEGPQKEDGTTKEDTTKEDSTTKEAKPPATVSLLSAALARERAVPASSAAQRPPPPPRPPPEPETQPLQVVNTKHAGQQGLRIRADGRLLATAGWDGRVRVFAARTLKPLAVLKWHQAGCFAVAFAPVGAGAEAHGSTEGSTEESTKGSTALAAREVSVKARRVRHAATAHWLAAGSKDGKVSLWDIF